MRRTRIGIGIRCQRLAALLSAGLVTCAALALPGHMLFGHGGAHAAHRAAATRHPLGELGSTAHSESAELAPCRLCLTFERLRHGAPLPLLAVSLSVSLLVLASAGARVSAPLPRVSIAPRAPPAFA